MKKAAVTSILVAVVLLALGVIAEAQQPKKVPRIGLRSSSASSESTGRDAFLQGLRDLGYVEGKNIAIEYRYTEGEIDRLPDLAAELVRLNVDVIVTAAISLFGLLRMRRQRFPLFSLLVMQLTVGSFPALQDQVETSLD